MQHTQTGGACALPSPSLFTCAGWTMGWDEWMDVWIAAAERGLANVIGSETAWRRGERGDEMREEGC